MGKMVSCSTLFYRRVGIGAYARVASKRHLLSSLRPACIWDVYSQDAMGR